MRHILAALVGLANGMFTGVGAAALLSILSIVPRLSQIIKAPEKMVGRGAIGIFFGATFAAAAMTLGWTVNLGLAGAVLAGVIAGVFVGLLAMSLAEVLQVMPVTLSNLSLKKGIPVFLMAILLGKTFGSILYFIYPIWP